MKIPLLRSLALPLALLASMGGILPAAFSEPALPAGLGAPSAPALPAGLGAPSAPALPAGLGAPVPYGQVSEPALPAASMGGILPALSGFAETRGGMRLQSDPHERNESIGEFRLQLRFDHEADFSAITVVSDFLYDPVLSDHTIRLKDGDGWLDLRQANILLRPTSFLDLKIGRQMNTWGTGDQLFINDLFPKDWNSFFAGRDDDYLKAPSDSLKAAFFSDTVNLDVIYSPRFDSDRYIDGRRISYWNAGLGRRAGRDAVVDVDKRDDAFKDDEWAARLYRQIGAYEVAAYGYHGFWKSPAGSDPETGKATFPRLQVVGASTRGPLGKGILSLETGYYHSREDTSGKDPFVQNSEMRYLVGYEQEVVPNFIVGGQYYIEQMLNYSNYKCALPEGMPKSEEFRQVMTVRMTKLLMNQNLALGLFVFYSPSDDDAYFRPNVNYKVDDHWIVDFGGNFFVGRNNSSFFGQFEKNNNIYLSARYGF